jgi:hypothetical protein
MSAFGIPLEIPAASSIMDHLNKKSPLTHMSISGLELPL